MSAEHRRFWRQRVAALGVRLADAVAHEAMPLRPWAAALAAHTPAGAPAGATPARLAAAEGRWQDAADGFSALLSNADAMDLMGQAIELHLRAAHALLRQRRLDEAAALLAPALRRMRDEGVRGHALMCGPQVLDALADASWSARLEASLLDELGAAARLSHQIRTGRPALEPGPAGPLSAREFEVLARIAAGDSNKLIARAFDLSPHTVKRHVANILDKLDLRSRGQASAWFHEHHA